MRRIDSETSKGQVNSSRQKGQAERAMRKRRVSDKRRRAIQEMMAGISTAMRQELRMSRRTLDGRCVFRGWVTAVGGRRQGWQGQWCGVQIAAEFPLCTTPPSTFCHEDISRIAQGAGPLSYSGSRPTQSSPFLVKVYDCVHAAAQNPLGTPRTRLPCVVCFDALFMPLCRIRMQRLWSQMQASHRSGPQGVANDHSRCIFSGSLWVRAQKDAVRQYWPGTYPGPDAAASYAVALSSKFGRLPFNHHRAADLDHGQILPHNWSLSSDGFVVRPRSPHR